MKLTQKYRRWGTISLTAWGLLMSGSQGFGGPVSPTPISPVVKGQPPAPPKATAEAAANVEVAWLSEPSLFACRLMVKPTNDGMEICGFIPNELVGKKALELAQASFQGKVTDKLKVQPGMLINFRQPSEPNELAAKATPLMAEKMGEKVIGLQMSCPKPGCVELSGTVANELDRLELSRVMRYVPGCTHVINRTTTQTESIGFAPPPAKSATTKSRTKEIITPSIVRTEARTTSNQQKVKTVSADGPQLPITDGPALVMESDDQLKAAFKALKQEVKTNAPANATPKAPAISPAMVADGPALPVISEPVRIIEEPAAQVTMAPSSAPTAVTQTPMSSKPGVGRAMVIVPPVVEGNSVEQQPMKSEAPVPGPAPAPVAPIKHELERRPEILPTPVPKPQPVVETPAQKVETVTVPSIAKQNVKIVTPPVASVPEWKTIQADVRMPAINEIQQKKTETKEPEAKVPEIMAPAPVVTQMQFTAPVIEQPAKVVAAPLPVVEAPKPAPVVETFKAADTCVAHEQPVPMAVASVPAAARVVEAPNAIELPKISQPIVVAAVPAPIVETQKQAIEEVKPHVTVQSPKVEPAPVVNNEAKASGFAANRAAKVSVTSEPKMTVKNNDAEQATVKKCEAAKTVEQQGTLHKTDCKFSDPEPIVSLASFSKNNAAAPVEPAAKQDGEKLMGIVRVPLTPGQSQSTAETARLAIENLCRGNNREVDVRTTGAHQITATVKVKSASEWSDLHKQMKTLREIAGYSVVYRIDLGDGLNCADGRQQQNAAAAVACKQGGTAPMMGVIRGKNTGSPMEPDTVRNMIETLCKGHANDVTVKSAGNRQVSIAMKVANPADWDALYSRIRQMPEIADYAVIFNVRVQ